MSDDEGAEALNSEVLTGLIDCGSLARPHRGLHHGLSTLQVKDYLSAFPVLEYDAHALRLGGEGEVGEDVVVLECARRICNLYKVLVPVGQLHSQGIGEADKGYFIWARRLELTNGAIRLIRVDGCYVVADRERSDSVTDDVLLLTPYFAAFASTLVLVRYKSRLSSHLV